jgi:PleD family two-component response regulator
MDLRMPVMDGKEAARRIRAIVGGREVKIVAVTASAFISEREEILTAGADDVIRKPYRASEIFDCMARLLGLSRIYSEQRQKHRTLHLRKEDLSALPQNLIRDLIAAILTLDDERIREVIARISECDAAVGDSLAEFANRTAFTAVLESAEAALTEKAQAASQS